MYKLGPAPKLGNCIDAAPKFRCIRPGYGEETPPPFSRMQFPGPRADSRRMSHCEPPLSPRNVLRLTAHPPDLKLIAAGLGIAYAIGCEAMTNANHNDGEQTNFIFGRLPDRENLGGRAA